MHDGTIQRWCAWSGVAGIGMFFLGLLIAQFFPPPSPSLTQSEVAAIYQQNANYIRAGMSLVLMSSLFIPPFLGVISLHLKRAESGSSLMAHAQLSAGSIGVLFIILPAVAFLITAFRPERPPELTYLMNDISWFLFILPWPSFFAQNIAIGIAVLRDRNRNPVFPRWLGFYNILMCLGMFPISLMVFYRSGPFAWNGLFPFWLPACLFGFWYAVMLAMLLRAIKRQEQEQISMSPNAFY